MDVMDMHGVGKSTMFQYKDDTIMAINKVFDDTISFPWGNEDACVKLAEGFYAANGRSLNGCVLAIDGLLVKQTCPDAYDETDSRKYFARKGFHALNVQAGCDADLRFRIVSVKCAGSTHDATAWAVTDAARIMRSDPEALPSWAYFVGDDAYKGQHDKVVCPWPGRRLRETDPALDDFNYHQSRCVLSRPYPALAKLDVLERFLTVFFWQDAVHDRARLRCPRRSVRRSVAPASREDGYTGGHRARVYAHP